MNREGKLFIVAAPSGAGKTSLVDALVKKVKNIQISISYTTRPPRPGEQDGRQYHFITEEIFDQMVQENAFLEHAVVFGYYYGTGKQWVRDQLAAGQDVILEIDWQGAALVRKYSPSAVSIFILPPSLEVLHQRLMDRRQDEPIIITDRMAKNKIEIEHYRDFDYLVINEEFEEALTDLRAIVKAERLRLNVQQQMEQKLLNKLLEKS